MGLTHDESGADPTASAADSGDVTHSAPPTNQPGQSATSSPPLTVGQVFGRALRLRCPRCGNSRLFRSWLRMEPECGSCGLNFLPEAGYYLGATYINYGLTTGILMFSYMGLHFGAGIDNRVLVPPLVAFCIIFPLSCFRWARAIWLGLDTLIDRPPDGP